MLFGICTLKANIYLATSVAWTEIDYTSLYVLVYLVGYRKVQFYDIHQVNPYSENPKALRLNVS